MKYLLVRAGVAVLAAALATAGILAGAVAAAPSHRRHSSSRHHHPKSPSRPNWCDGTWVTVQDEAVTSPISWARVGWYPVGHLGDGYSATESTGLYISVSICLPHNHVGWVMDADADPTAQGTPLYYMATTSFKDASTATFMLRSNASGTKWWFTRS